MNLQVWVFISTVDVDTRKSHLFTVESAAGTHAHAPQVCSAQWMEAARRKHGREGEEESGGNASGGSVTE